MDAGPRHDAHIDEFGVELASRLGRVLATAREYLQLDVVFLSHFDGENEVFLIGDGDIHSFEPVVEGGTVPLSDSYCDLVVRQCLPRVVADASSHDVTRDLWVTRSAGIGAYVGVPVYLADGSLYGTLCCLSHSPRDSLGEHSLKLLEFLAELSADEIERHGSSDRVIVMHHGVARALMAPLQFDAALEQAIAAVCKALGSPGGAIWLTDGRAGPALRASWDEAAPEGAAPEAERSPAQSEQRVMRVLVSNALVEEADDGAEAQDRGLASVAVPLAAGDGPVLGVLDLPSAPPTTPLPPELRSALLSVGAQLGEFLAGRDGPRDDGALTRRELDVLEGAANGSTVEEIADSLVLSTATVRTHLRNIYRKLGVRNRAGAVAQGLRRRMIA